MKWVCYGEIIGIEIWCVVCYLSVFCGVIRGGEVVVGVIYVFFFEVGVVVDLSFCVGCCFDFSCCNIWFLFGCVFGSEYFIFNCCF